MRIASNKGVTIDYTVSTERGVLVDSSGESERLSYIQGGGSMIPALETALEGKAAGDRVSTVVPPDQGYGKRDDALMRAVPRDGFDPVIELEPGMRFEVPSTDGNHIVTVVAIEGNEAIIDGNHPLAGLSLHFDVTVVEVREATREELRHGHVHRAGDDHD